ncbi:MAG TPA: YitT family protein [Candidatus Gemmiger avicola]|uniref:YitT family protein n=1 Tax=Candidatus Gemmiger avicola TaxID=2838605 RepID=A0A9D2S2T5_9FIRM|nr:YitT family protein [Candidatus Gemmiger avicola]
MTDNRLKNLALEVLGCFISALGTYSFAVVAQVPVTGVAGIGAILYHLWGLPIGMTNILLNIPIVLVCFRLLGRGFFLRSVRCMVLFAFFTDFVLPALPVYSGDRLLAAVCGGVVMGIGDALIYMQNSSTGGLDFVTMAIKVKHPHMPFGNLTFGAAMAVIIANGLVFRDVDAIIYGILLNFLASTVINKMMFGFNSCMLAMIVTEDGPAVCAAIDEAVDRGSTILKAYGGYKQERRDVVLCACSSKQLYEIEKLVKRMDPASFTIMLQANEVQGEGFRRLVLGKGEEKK